MDKIKIGDHVRIIGNYDAAHGDVYHDIPIGEIVRINGASTYQNRLAYCVEYTFYSNYVFADDVEKVE